MATQSFPTSEKKPGALLVIVLIVLTIAAALLVFGSGSLLEELPFTQHALTAHSNQKWNATSISNFFTKGGCTPQEYTCPVDDTRILYCDLKPDLSIGLVIGLTVEKIITGFAAPPDYWHTRCP